ncbi:MAG: hypothetical protein EKK37_16820 [Sphingobacteriales bacterium]|nr:MAG: hypothetical protein EKK37_16820 [Sphingobacteriales bacterium]
MALGELAVGKDEFEKRTKLYFDKVIPDLTNLYDIYHKLIATINDYKVGVENGKYFKVDERGHSSLDRLNEVTIRNLTKDFIIRAKILQVNFFKCGFADEDNFKLTNFFTFEKNKLAERKKLYLKKSDGKYLPLINLIEKANDNFLKQLTDLRGAIEHDLFSLEKFQLNRKDNIATISEPDLEGQLLSTKLKFFYENSLEFIEKMMVYYFGVNGEVNKNGFLQLYVDDVFDYSEMRWKYTFALGGTPWSFTSKKCLYD